MARETVLVVEDSPDDEFLVRRVLKQSGFHGDVYVARSGMDALEYLLGTGAHGGRATAPLPRLVLLDLKLPGLDGVEVLLRIRADRRTRLLPVVIFSSSNEKEDIRNGYLAGANSFVRKPVVFSQYCAAVQQLKAYWLSLNEPPPSVEKS